jgi:hypothetical protein
MMVAEPPQQALVQTQHCVSCHAANPGGSAYCLACGASMTVIPPQPIYTQPMYPPPVYGQQMHPHGDRRRTDTCAVLANAFGLLSLFAVPLLFGAAAVVLGAVSFQRIKEDPHILKGRGQAMSGIIIGILGVLWWVIQITAAAQQTLPPQP